MSLKFVFVLLFIYLSMHIIYVCIYLIDIYIHFEIWQEAEAIHLARYRHKVQKSSIIE